MDLPTLSRPVRQGVLEIPGGPSHPLGQLPAGSAMADELQACMPDLQVWFTCALEYYRLGREGDFLAILERTQIPSVSSVIPDDHGEAARVLNALAGYHLSKAVGERDPQARDDSIHEVTKWISRANRLDAHVLTATSSSLSNLVSGKLDMADSHLDGISDSTLATMLVRAAIHYNKGEFDMALRLFSRTLQANPECSASVRFGLGLCYYQLNRQDMAQKCFERALALDNELVEPRVALAIIKLNSGDVAQVQPAMRLLQEAFKIDDQHPRVANFFADHYIYRRDYLKTIKLAERARSNTNLDEVYSESEYHLGRARHAMGDFAAAHTHYEQAVQKNSKNTLAQFGLAQILLHESNVNQAVPHLEQVLNSNPEDFSSLHILGTINARRSHFEDAKEYLQRAIDAETTDPETLIEFAQLMEFADRPKSLMAYRAALKLCAERGEEPQDRLDRLQNNVAVMQQRLGNLDAAYASYEALFGGNLPELSAAQLVERNVLCAFNLARLHEERKDYAEARSVYNAILEKHVSYTDCYLRLSCIDRAEGDLDGAMEQLRAALTVHNDLPDALAMMGNLHIEKRELHAAQLKFERILEKVDRKDPYALVSLGNIYYMARTDRKERKERNMKYAADSFWQVLKGDTHNLFAANGLGMIFAAEGRLGAAGEIFTRVREGTTAMGDVVVNLAHIYVARGEFQKAVILYESALRKHFNDSHPKLLLYLSRAYFEAKEYEQAVKNLERCIALAQGKTDLALKFNLGLIKERSVEEALKEDEMLDPRRVEEHLETLQEAKRVFEGLIQEWEQEQQQQQQEKGDEEADEGDKKRKHVSEAEQTVAKARKHVEKCDELAEHAKEVMAKVQELVSEKDAMRRAREERLRQRQADRQAAQRRKREEEKAEAQELASIAENDMKVLREEMVHWKPLTRGMNAPGEQQPRERRQPGSGRKKKSKRRELEDEVADLSPVAKKERPRRAAAKPSMVEDDLEGDDDDGLEEWQKAIMNPKISELVNSKRTREDKEKRGRSSKRSRELVAPPSPPPPAAPEDGDDGLVLPEEED